MARPQKRIRGFLRKVPGRRMKTRVRPHMRIKRTDIKRRGKGR